MLGQLQGREVWYLQDVYKRQPLCNTGTLEVLFANSFPNHTSDKAKHKAGNQQNRRNPHRHICTVSYTHLHPELVFEWSEKNLPLTPDDITFGSNKKIWWKGTCGHE